MAVIDDGRDLQGSGDDDVRDLLGDGNVEGKDLLGSGDNGGEIFLPVLAMMAEFFSSVVQERKHVF